MLHHSLHASTSSQRDRAGEKRPKMDVRCWREASDEGRLRSPDASGIRSQTARMDHYRFDRIARRMAVAGDRRKILRGALVSAAWFVISVPWRGVSSQDDCVGGCATDEVCVDGLCARACTTDRDCRSKKKDDPCILNSCVDGICVEAVLDCLPGYECCERGTCCPKGCVVDAECVVLDPCRWGRCGLDGLCAFTELDPCIVCATDDDCRGNGEDVICCGGACQRPCPEGTAISKGCECRADGSATLDGLVVHDDASG